MLTPVTCRNLLLVQVKRESRDHATLSDLYLNNIIPRFAQVSDDSGRLFKKVTHTHIPIYAPEQCSVVCVPAYQLSLLSGTHS